ncbi:nitroreductase [Mycobacterium sp. URHB0021]
MQRLDMGPLVAAASGGPRSFPPGWSFLLALRSHGLGSVWTTLHLSDEKAVAEHRRHRLPTGEAAPLKP